MRARINPGAAFALSGAVAAFVSARHRLLLGISFLVTVAAALSLNGMRATLASVHIPLSDADDRLSVAAVARTIRRMVLGKVAFLSIMSVVYAVAAARSDVTATRVFAAAFSVAAGCAGPLTSVRRRPALWAAAFTVVTLLLWSLSGERV